MTRPISCRDQDMILGVVDIHRPRPKLSDIGDRYGIARPTAPDPLDDLYNILNEAEAADRTDTPSDASGAPTAGTARVHAPVRPNATPEAPAPAPVAANDDGPSSPAPDRYVFPPWIRSGNFNDLTAELTQIAEQYKKSSDYLIVRKDYCAVSLALNVAGTWAPRFRRQPLIRPGVKGAGADLMHRDQVVIDVHWLWATCAISAVEGRYGSLVDSAADFDFKVAAQYACENWTSDYRAEEHLSLPDALQWQLLTIRSKKHVAEYQAIFDGTRDGGARQPARVNKAMKQIRTWADASRSVRGQEWAYRALWCAREMLGRDASARAVGRLAVLILGRTPWDESTVRGKLKVLERHVRA